MNLTKVERLTLINQYKLLMAADKFCDHTEEISILKNGYANLYHELCEDLQPDMDLNSGEFYMNVLRMHQDCNIPFRGLAIDDPNVDYVGHLLRNRFHSVGGQAVFRTIGSPPNYTKMYSMYLMHNTQSEDPITNSIRAKIITAGIL